MSETRRRYPKFSGQQKLELVMASLSGERSIAALERALGKKTYGRGCGGGWAGA